jgi:hypothetical protein
VPNYKKVKKATLSLIKNNDDKKSKVVSTSFLLSVVRNVCHALHLPPSNPDVPLWGSVLPRRRTRMLKYVLFSDT